MRMIYVFVLLAAGATPGWAQSDNALLQGILCEIRELRAAFNREQTITPMLDANRSEREFEARRLTEVLERQRLAEEQVAQMSVQMAEIGQKLAELRTTGSAEMTLQAAQELEARLQRDHQAFTAAISQVQGSASRAAAEATTFREKIQKLEAEYRLMQEEIRNKAETSSSLCAISPQQ